MFYKNHTLRLSDFLFYLTVNLTISPLIIAHRMPPMLATPLHSATHFLYMHFAHFNKAFCRVEFFL